MGNVRLSYTKSSVGTEIIEENNYYPFGLSHDSYNPGKNPAYNYQYNGKELQQETGWSDYGARMYMSDLGRWGVIDPLSETNRRFSPYHYAYNNPISFIDPDGKKPQGPQYEAESVMAPLSLWSFYGGGGGNNAALMEFVAQNNGWGAFQQLMKSRGMSEGGGISKNIIINFLRGDKGHLGNFVNSDFAANGWHIIDALSLKDALTQLSSYLGDSEADNIYINAHGLASERYVFDEKGELIPDLKSDTGYKMTGDTGFYTAKDQILGSDIQQYISGKSKLSQDKINSIDSFIGIASYVKSGKNLIMGSCWTVRFDDLFGTGVSSIVKSRDIFANRDFSSNYIVKGKGIIPFQNFINYNQTSREFYVDGWVQYRDGAVSKRNFNIIMTKYGVKTIK